MTEENKIIKYVPRSLLKIAGREVYCQVINRIECCIRSEEKICFCEKYQGCAPYHCSNSTYLCGNCRLITDYMPHYIEQKMRDDPNNLIKITIDFYSRLKEIAEIDGEKSVNYAKGTFCYTDYWLNPYSIFYEIFPGYIFVDKKSFL